MMRRVFAVALAVLLLPGCSKENEVAGGTGSLAAGAQCDGPDDPGCGVGAVCVLGYCRMGCTTDAECDRGALCLGDVPPYGCSLQDELSCKGNEGICKDPLVCGVDGKCRFACATDADCRRNEHLCLGGTCVSRSEPDAEKTWLSCFSSSLGAMAPTAVRCSYPDWQLEVCNTLAPGWQPVEGCDCREGSSFLPQPSGWCVRCEIDFTVNCEAEEQACQLDETCRRCAQEKYEPSCESNPTYAELATCGCAGDAGPPPPPPCDTCAMSEETESQCGRCTTLVSDPPELCMGCLVDGNMASCADPRMQDYLTCVCGACPSDCQAQCEAGGGGAGGAGGTGGTGGMGGTGTGGTGGMGGTGGSGGAGEFAWQQAGVGDCPSSDVGQTQGSAIPAPDKCHALTAGQIAICWDGVTYQNGGTQPWCTYKSVSPGQCTGGGQLGVMYVCASL